MNGISVALLRPLVELMGRLDVDAAAVLAALGIDDATPPETYVAGEVVDRCFEELDLTLPDARVPWAWRLRPEPAAEAPAGQDRYG